MHTLNVLNLNLTAEMKISNIIPMR